MRLPTVVIRSHVLESWLTVSNYSKSRLASELHISKGRISQLLSLQTEPSAHLIAKLLSLTYLPFDRLFTVVHDKTSPLPATRLNSPKTSVNHFVNSTRKTVVAATSRRGRRRQGAGGRSRVPSSLKGAR